MDILALKAWYEAATQPRSSEIDVVAAWRLFQEGLRLDPEGESCEEFGVGFGIEAGKAGWITAPGEPYLQVYFGRLIDAEKDRFWRTAEINWYFQVVLDAECQCLLEKQPEINVEGAFCLSEGDTAIQEKRTSFIRKVEEQRELWSLLQRHPAVKQVIQFFIY